MPDDLPLSVPVQPSAPPRPLTPEELSGLLAIADVLIPEAGEMPAASKAPSYERWLDRALAARSESFDVIATQGARFATLDDAQVEPELRRLAAEDKQAFDPVSAVVAGAYLMIPQIRKAIGYPGQERNHAPFDQAAEEIMDGILDPVIERGFIYTPADA